MKFKAKVQPDSVNNFDVKYFTNLSQCIFLSFQVV